MSVIGYESFLVLRTSGKNALLPPHQLQVVALQVTVDKAVSVQRMDTGIVAWTVDVRHLYISPPTQITKTSPVSSAMGKTLLEQTHLRFGRYLNSPAATSHRLARPQPLAPHYRRFPHLPEGSHLNPPVHVHHALLGLLQIQSPVDEHLHSLMPPRSLINHYHLPRLLLNISHLLLRPRVSTGHRTTRVRVLEILAGLFHPYLRIPLKTVPPIIDRQTVASIAETLHLEVQRLRHRRQHQNVRQLETLPILTPTCHSPVYRRYRKRSQRRTQRQARVQQPLLIVIMPTRHHAHRILPLWTI